MFQLDYLALLLAGLLGGAHCLGMCGGLVAAISLQLPARQRGLYLVLFNLGRLAGYMLVGALLGGLASLVTLTGLQQIKQVLALLAALLLVLLGLYLAGFSQLLVRFERLGVPLWRSLQPILQRCLPLRRPWQALLAGVLWGWMPCGLVYTASLAALASASAVQGAGVMLLFGLGTLPNLLLLGFAGSKLLNFFRNKWLKIISGVIVAGWGVHLLLQGFF